ncbi:citrate synthase [Collibacillus ludicampi]|uniref:Citrate synthase n=1 Tax=Collibacillus ludicampi TaxID=2771369 RepID=A0AAV4LH44_9BACL|nr:citrate synthase [Collibacillus ludicampi]GIM47146.1 citrate synthase [Collibacillus ludicampi]
MSNQTYKAGLEDVIAGVSEICFIDGDEGRLVYRGYDIHDLVNHQATFEEVVYLLWHGELPNKEQLDAITKDLKENRELHPELVNLLKSLPKDSTPMEVLRTVVSTASMYDPDNKDNSREANIRKATRLVAQIPTIVAYNERLRKGLDVIPPKKDNSLAENFLYMLTGKQPNPLEARAFNIALILHADHEWNASTFAARVTAATLSDMYSAITSAIGTLKGPLHGGANEQVMRMLLEIGEPEKAEEWVKNALANKQKIMGFGHRVYHTEDPRATHLRQMSKELGEREGQTKWFEMSQIIEKVVHEQKGLYPNVDFYSASTYYVMGIDVEIYTPIFACSRISGWTAHVLEQYSNNRLIRPRADYVGVKRRTYVPIEQR